VLVEGELDIIAEKREILTLESVNHSLMVAREAGGSEAANERHQVR
jgi:hypothetical protein